VICERVVADARALSDPLEGLVRIGIDEISYRRGHKYLTVVVDHDTGRLVWPDFGGSFANTQVDGGAGRRCFPYVLGV